MIHEERGKDTRYDSGMRLLTVGIGGVLLLAAALGFYLLFQLPAVGMAGLVPHDFVFGVFYSSIDDLREAYEAPGARNDADPGRLRVGDRVNVPDLDGVAQSEPVGVYWTARREEVFLVPTFDAGSFEDAFEQSRENTRLRAPRRVSKQYVSLSESSAVAEPQERDAPLVARAAGFPIALAGRPKDAETLRFMLQYLLAWEPRQKPAGLPILAREVGKLPESFAGFAARAVDGFVLGFEKRPTPAAPVQVDLWGAQTPGGVLERGAAAARDLDLGGLASTFPHDTVVLAGAALDAKGWKELGLPLPAGDAAVAFGIVDRRHYTRRYTLLVTVRPRKREDLARLEQNGAADLLGAFGAGLEYRRVMDEATAVKTAELADAPAWMLPVFHAESKRPPPLYVTTAMEGGIWFCAVGSQAEGIVRYSLGCLRDPHLGLRRTAPVAAHKGFFDPGHLALGYLSTAGLKAFRRTMPCFEIASLGQPVALTAVLDLEKDGIAGLLRILR